MVINSRQKKAAHLHDRTFRSAMSDLRVAQDFLTHHLPPAIQYKVDLTTLTLRKESYVDEGWKMLVTDVLYTVGWKDKSKIIPAFIYVLCEHLSAPQKLAPWRMVTYICRIVEQHLKETTAKTLPLVL